MTVFLDNHCSPTYARHLHWNWTRAGDVAIQPCPSKSTGLARWTCNPKTLTFQENQPDMSDCKSAVVTDLETRVREQDPENVIVSGKIQCLDFPFIFGDLQFFVKSILQGSQCRTED